MSLIVTPKQLSHRAELYAQLAALTSAGLGLPKALDTLRRSPPARSQRSGLTQIISDLEAGNTFAESLRRATGWAPVFDVALLQASETSGRLDSGFRLLAEHYRERASMLREAISHLLYPVFLVHAAIFLFPFASAFVTGRWGTYLLQTLGSLALIYAAVFLVLLACQGQRGESWRGFWERVFRYIPILGTAQRAWALARLCAALEALVSAGIPIIEGWHLAAAASGSPAMRHTVDSWKERLLAGTTPGELVSESREFPELFSSQYQTGELTGKLDECLLRLHRYYQDEATRRFRAVAQWLPRMVYLIIALVIAFRIVRFYTDYFGQLNQLL
jgi:type II secretory pathway component PulF